jgi:hypothetical protein
MMYYTYNPSSTQNMCERSNNFFFLNLYNQCLPKYMKIKFSTSSNLFIVRTIILQIMSLQIKNVKCILCIYSLVILLCLKASKLKSYAKVLSTQNIGNPNNYVTSM